MPRKKRHLAALKIAQNKSVGRIAKRRRHPLLTHIR